MSDLVSRWPHEYSFALFLVVGVCLVAALVPVAIVATIQWRQSRQAELDYHLKREMLARGMSPVEIEQVMLAGRERPVG